MEEQIRGILTTHLNAIKAGIIARMQVSGTFATGKTASSLSVKIGDGSASLNGNKTLLYLQRGRGPGKVPYGIYDKIREWIIAKGINYQAIYPKARKPETALRSLAGAIVHNIMTKGTKMYRDHRYNDIYDTVLNEELEKIANETQKIFELNIETMQEDKEDEKK